MITLGLWPIAGITTMGVTDRDARATIETAMEAGITSFDTAFSYGYDGESDRFLGVAIAGRRDRFTVMGKVGQRWSPEQTRVIDASPKQLIADAETSLSRMGIEAFDVLFLHSPDPHVPIEQSAEAMETLRKRGLCRRIGVCNVNATELDRFCSVAPCHAVQCPLNLLQSESLDSFIPRCTDHGADVFVFWTLMKGLLAGKITRDHSFAPGDSRSGYAVFQGEARERAHRVVDELANLGNEIGKTVAQLAIGWVLAQDGVTGALVGARRPDQVRELAGATPLSSEWVERIDQMRR